MCQVDSVESEKGANVEHFKEDSEENFKEGGENDSISGETRVSFSFDNILLAVGPTIRGSNKNVKFKNITEAGGIIKVGNGRPKSKDA